MVSQWFFDTISCKGDYKLPNLLINEQGKEAAAKNI